MSVSRSQPSRPSKTKDWHPRLMDYGHDVKVGLSRANEWLQHHQGLLWVIVAALIILMGVARHLWIKARNGKRLAMLSRSSERRNASTKLAKMLGCNHEEARRVIERWGEKRIVLRYPKHFPALDRQIREVPEILKRLTGQDWDLTHDAKHNRLVYTPHVEVVMPERVSYKWSAEDPADLIPIGRDERNEPVLADLTGLTPHVLVSAPTGFGKTTILSVIVAHVAGHGGLVDILDPKHIGFVDHVETNGKRTGPIFEDLPNVRIHTEIGEMMSVVKRFRQDIDNAYRAMKQGTRPEGSPLRLLVVDELGTFCEMVVDLWREEGNKGTPEVYGDMKRILWLGRAAGYHVIGAAQQANVKAVFGASDPRDQFALRIASGPQSPEAWSFMFGKQPVPNLPARRGLASVGVGTAFRTVQLAHLSTAEARAIAARGKARFSTSPVGDTAHVEDVVSLDKVENTGGVSPDDVVPTFPTLTVVKPPMIEETISPARAPIKPQEGPGRPADRPAVTLECGGCGHSWATRTKPGGSVKCPQCRKSRRVPVGAGAG
jgi:hypothetical protein